MKQSSWGADPTYFMEVLQRDGVHPDSLFHLNKYSSRNLYRV